MRIAHILTNSNAHFEELKRTLQRKEMSETYKKNSSFVKISKNPMAEMLGNLLSDKAEMNEREDEVAPYSEEKPPRYEGKEELPVQLGTTTLEPIETPLQEFPITESPSAQMQETVLQTASEMTNEEPFSNERFDFTIPERFMKEFNWNIHQETVFGKDLERLIYQRTYFKAISKYNFQMQMAKNDFKVEEPRLSLTA